MSTTSRPVPCLRPLRVAALVGAVVGAAPASAAAQSGAPLLAPEPGRWVRIHTTVGPVYTGRLTAASTADTLQVSTPPHRALRGMPLQESWRTFAVPASAVSVLESGRDHGGRWLVGGTLIGAGLGFATGVAVLGSHDASAGSAGDANGAGTVVTTIGGAVAGWFLAKATKVHYSTAWRRAG